MNECFKWVDSGCEISIYEAKDSHEVLIFTTNNCKKPKLGDYPALFSTSPSYLSDDFDRSTVVTIT